MERDERAGWVLAAIAAAVCVACTGDDTDGTTVTTTTTTTTTTSNSGGSAGSGGVGGSVSSGGSAGEAGAGGAAGQGGGGAAGCSPGVPVDATVPDLLSQTGLYGDIGQKTLAPYVKTYTPRFPLWSDGAVKSRFIYLPTECGPIDNSDEDYWQFPVGTRLWKEFEVGGSRIETRMVERTGPGELDYLFAAYQWDAGETEATRVPNGVVDANGTSHDIPEEQACKRCHGTAPGQGGVPGRILGFSAIQLSHAGPGETMASLSNAGLLLFQNAAGYAVPGDATAQAALGYLHGNCGNCHNGSSPNGGLPFLDFYMWLEVGETTLETTGTWVTGVGQPTSLFVAPGITSRIEPGQPQASCVWHRMNERGNAAQMPPIGSEITDPTGLAAVAAFISAIP